MPQSILIQRSVKTKSLKALAEAIARSNGEVFSYGAKLLLLSNTGSNGISCN